MVSQLGSIWRYALEVSGTLMGVQSDEFGGSMLNDNLKLCPINTQCYMVASRYLSWVSYESAQLVVYTATLQERIGKQEDMN